MKRILFIIQADAESGSGKCALELLSLQQRDLYKTIVVTQYTNSLNSECDKIGIENYALHYARTCSLGNGIIGFFIALFARPLLNFISYKRLSKKINLREIDVIHTNDSTIDFGAYLHRKLKKPHIWHIREFLVFNKIFEPIIPNLPQYIIQNSTFVITVSNTLKSYLVKKTTPSNKIQTIYDGVKRTIQKEKANIHQQSSTIKAICLGNYCPAKGQSTLLMAIARLPPEIQNKIHFDFFGDNFSGEKQKLIKYAGDHDVVGSVSFHDRAENIADLLFNYDIGIQPSHSEGFSRVTAEYMMAGLCVIAANEGAIPELIQHNENGFLYEDYNIQDLANLLVSCCNNINDIKRVAASAQQKALNLYCIEKNVQNILNIYDS